MFGRCSDHSYMRIGNLPKPGESTPLNKWTISIEISKCPPWMIPRGAFKPYINIVCVKFSDFGEPGKIDGRPEKYVGGWRKWVSPFGIRITIERL